jgi:hypothetical protein
MFMPIKQMLSPIKPSTFPYNVEKRWMPITRRRIGIATFIVTILLIAPSRARASEILFDNGAVGPGGMWDMTASHGMTVYDDFLLSSASVITAFDYDAWLFWPNYVSTSYSVLDRFGGIVLASGTVVGRLTPNGLADESTAAGGFLIQMSGLDISLGPGVYVLGLTANTDGSLEGIGTGAGSRQTLGAGLLQNDTLRVGDDMSFRVYGDPVPVPEPGSFLLLSTGLGVVVAKARRRTRRVQ